jgi:hypothetical protein|uniref:Uncharacterized protein n=1 Tax=Zea mays TaxID=4577 RepID=A0A804LQ86_MAIZE
MIILHWVESLPDAQPGVLDELSRSIRTSKVPVCVYDFHLCLNIQYRTHRHVCSVDWMGMNVGFKANNNGLKPYLCIILTFLLFKCGGSTTIVELKKLML